MDIRLSLKPYKQYEKNNKNTDVPKVTDFKMAVTKQSPVQYQHAAMYVGTNAL